MALYALAAVLTAKPEPASPYVVEQLDDEWAVLMPAHNHLRGACLNDDGSDRA